MKNNNTAQRLVEQITIQEALMETRMKLWEHLKDKPEKTLRDIQQEGNLLMEITRINDKINRLRRDQVNENTPHVAAAVDYEAWCRDLIRDADIRYTAKPNAYWLRREHAGEARNIPIPPLAFRERFSRLQDRELREYFDRLMEEQKRKFDEVIYSFTPQGPSVLNLMDIRNWVPPVEGEVNDLFDILLWSVGGGTEEGYEHLRQCLLWKYMHPADFMLPSPVLYGEGGVGKNFLIDGVLKTLFAGTSTSLGISQVLGGFNGLMAGKSVVMVNEAAGDRAETNGLDPHLNSCRH